MRRALGRGQSTIRVVRGGCPAGVSQLTRCTGFDGRRSDNVSMGGKVTMTKMKRSIAVISIILVAAMMPGCGGGNGSGPASSSGTSKVSIAISGLRAAALSSASVQSNAASIQFTISASDMDTISSTVPVTGDTMTESFVVPNGSSRHFLAKALASDSTVLSEGDAFADLNGTPTNINISMGVEIAGEWTFTFVGPDGTPSTDFFTFTQSGNSLTISGTTSATSLLKSAITGTGTMVGNDIQFTVAGAGCGNASSVTGTGTLYSDGSMGGNFTQTGGCGSGSGTWRAVSGHIVPPPSQGAVAGTVTDAVTSGVLAGVTVRLSQQGSLVASGTTGSTGTYVLTASPGSGYSIEFSKSGYTTNTIGNITISSNATTTVNASLSSTPPPSVQGTVSGTVTDAVTNGVLAGVTVRLSQQGSLVVSGATGSNGTYSLTAPANSGYSIEFSKSGYTTKTTDNITVAANSVTTADAALAPIPVSGVGTLSGIVTDALSGQPLPGVSVRLLSGSTVIATVTNNQDGTYAVSGPSGSGYAVEFSKAGYITSTASNVTIVANTTTANVNMTLSPVLQQGQTRIILTWGPTPPDLDSHLTGPIPDSTARFHIYYADMGSATSSPFAALDVDATEGFGPETTTIYQQFSGVYRFSVRDFTNGGEGTTSTALSNSGAQVNVYQGNNRVATFNVPTNTGGDVWTVFELNGNIITPINTMTFVPDETTIQSTSGKGGLKKTKGR